MATPRPLPVASRVSDFKQKFSDIVAQDVRGEINEADAEILHNPDNLDDWYDALITLKCEVENQLSNTNARLVQAERDKTGEDLVATRARETEQRVRKIKFLTAINKRLIHVKQLRRYDRMNASYYRRAIVAHKSALEEMDLSFSEADEALHSVL